MLAIRLPADIEERLESLARASGRSKAAYGREAIIEHFADLLDAELAATRIRALENSKANTTPLADLIKRYGVEG
jgi:RHH-type transcriptional regulator, rel operon repressor / antitoxin RelB